MLGSVICEKVVILCRCTIMCDVDKRRSIRDELSMFLHSGGNDVRCGTEIIFCRIQSWRERNRAFSLSLIHSYEKFASGNKSKRSSRNRERDLLD